MVKFFFEDISSEENFIKKIQEGVRTKKGAINLIKDPGRKGDVINKLVDMTGDLLLSKKVEWFNERKTPGKICKAIEDALK